MIFSTNENLDLSLKFDRIILYLMTASIMTMFVLGFNALFLTVIPMMWLSIGLTAFLSLIFFVLLILMIIDTEKESKIKKNIE